MGSDRGVLPDALRAKRLGGLQGSASARVLASGSGWSLYDVICTAGPGDTAFEERHGAYSISLVIEGSFHYRSGLGKAALTPGSLLLGTMNSCFECGHEHGEGDRCLSFHYAPDFLDEAQIDWRRIEASARVSLPARKRWSGVAARAVAAAGGDTGDQVLALDMLEAVAGFSRDAVDRSSPAQDRRVMDVARRIQASPESDESLADMADSAGLSPFHFLRTFRRVTGVTPHQYRLRLRLRFAAESLLQTKAPVTDIAYDAGFGDLSNFVRSFSSEFGMSPTRWRARWGGQAKGGS